MQKQLYPCTLYCFLGLEMGAPLFGLAKSIYILKLFLHRICYFRIQRALAGGQGKFLEDLNSTYGSGVLTCDFEGPEFKGFLKWLMKNYFRCVCLLLCIEK